MTIAPSPANSACVASNRFCPTMRQEQAAGQRHLQAHVRARVGGDLEVGQRAGVKQHERRASQARRESKRTRAAGNRAIRSRVILDRGRWLRRHRRTSRGAIHWLGGRTAWSRFESTRDRHGHARVRTALQARRRLFRPRRSMGIHSRSMALTPWTVCSMRNNRAVVFQNYLSFTFLYARMQRRAAVQLFDGPVNTPDADSQPSPGATPSTPRLLVVDDEPGILPLVERFGVEFGFEVTTRGGGAGALAAVPVFRPDVVICRSADAGARRARRAPGDPRAGPRVPGDPDDRRRRRSIRAIEAVKLGRARLPDQAARLRAADARCSTDVRESIARRQRLLRDRGRPGARRFEFYGMIGRSAAMQELFDPIRRLAPHVRTVAHHRRDRHRQGARRARAARAGPRRDPAVRHRQLFRHRRDAVRERAVRARARRVHRRDRAQGGAVRDGATAARCSSTRSASCRWRSRPSCCASLENGEVQRVGATASRRRSTCASIAATNRDLRDGCAPRARSAAICYYRLNIIEIALPPLRERREDIPYLTAAFVREFATRFGKPVERHERGRRAAAAARALAGQHPRAAERARTRLHAERGPDPQRARSADGIGRRRAPAAEHPAERAVPIVKIALPPPELLREQARAGAAKSRRQQISRGADARRQPPFALSAPRRPSPALIQPVRGAVAHLCGGSVHTSTTAIRNHQTAIA